MPKVPVRKRQAPKKGQKRKNKKKQTDEAEIRAEFQHATSGLNTTNAESSSTQVFMVDHGYFHVSQGGPIPSTSTSTSNNESFEDQCITNESSNVKTSQVSMLDHGYCSQVPQEGLILSTSTSNNNESFEDQCMTKESSDVEMVLSTSVPSTLENVVDVEASSEDLLLQVKEKTRIIYF